ncbi:ead/Ea22-like family protein [Shimwellia pseudoproteus]|uniref:ead/Ea22-like family protein n=1 Tax=Shimwellia pseudoproteus TaxID=570012 RepID=UPI0018EDE66C|nr:ead/Ea22-like family protein [Shimwellia pseudoproteus]MBJ3816556.1 ead/Ea22-like family protein [Shimwellia pseudoproteus]
MTALNKQALRQTAEKAQEHGVFNMDIHSETVLALLDELEAAEKRIAEACAGWGNCQLTMGVYCHAYEEAKTHIAELIHNHRVHAARLIDERIVLKERIAELSASHSKLRDTMATIHNTIRMDGGYTPLAAILNAAKRAHEESATAAGIGVKGE